MLIYIYIRVRIFRRVPGTHTSIIQTRCSGYIHESVYYPVYYPPISDFANVIYVRKARRCGLSRGLSRRAVIGGCLEKGCLLKDCPRGLAWVDVYADCSRKAVCGLSGAIYADSSRRAVMGGCRYEGCPIGMFRRAE